MQNSYSLIKKIIIKTKGNIDSGKKGNKRIRLLILSYHYLPMNVIASYRPAGFAQHLHKFGIYPTIVTHRWELDVNQKWQRHKNNDDVKIEDYDNHKVIRIPRYHSIRGILYNFFEKNLFTRRLIIIIRWLLGFLDPGANNIDSYISYKQYLFKHLKTNSYDLVMGIYSPHHHLKLCYEINKKFGIPYFLDFRDLWDNSSTHPNYLPKGGNKLFVHQIKKYWSIWLSKSVFFTSLSKLWVDEINKLTTISGHIVMHGYDEDVAEIQKLPISKKQFIILYVGSLYINQDLEGYLRGLKKFIVDFNPDNLKLVFLGSSRINTGKENIGFIENIDTLIDKYLNKSLYTITERLARPEVLRWYKKSALLLSLTYNSFPGTYGGKFFEYVGTRRPILVYNDPNNIISEAVLSDKLGYICKNNGELATVLKLEYGKWQKKIAASEINPRAMKYSREFQTKVLSDIINQIVKKNK